MIELRKDYILDRWVILSEGRKDRPREFKKKAFVESEGVCYFCNGNEHLTPPEIGRIEENGKWKLRWFLNKFPFILKHGSPELKKKGLLEFGNSYGYHEIIVETPEHKKQFANHSVKDIADILNVVSNRIKELSTKKGVKYVAVFKNHGPEAGTSIIHSHMQIAAYNKIPTLVMEETKRSIKGSRCIYCNIIKKEGKSKRAIYQNKSFIAFTPFASRFNYEAWIFPKKHYNNFTEMPQDILLHLAEIMKKIFSRLAVINPSYNFFLHYAPKGKKLHFHIEITPRIATWGGFEIQTGEIVNSVKPEEAARFYRERI